MEISGRFSAGSAPVASLWDAPRKPAPSKKGSRYNLFSGHGKGRSILEGYRIVEGIGVYFATFTIVDWLAVFIAEEPGKIITDGLNFCIGHKFLRVNAYVIMPTHLHLIVFDAQFDPERLKRTLADFRKFKGRKLADFCGTHMPASYARTFKDRAGEDRQRRFWQATQHPVGIFTERFWKQKMDYLHANPCRKGLVRAPEDWRFSSAAFWLKTRLENDVNLSDAVWVEEA